MTTMNPQIIKNLLGEGDTLSTTELQQLISESSILKPSVGEFWRSCDGVPGMYILVDGKVRLVDNTDRLIRTLKPEEKFGQKTLFPDESRFSRDYKVRASTDVEIYFIPIKALLPLINKYPQIRESLLQQAKMLDSDVVSKSATPEVLHNNNSPQNGFLKLRKKNSSAYFPHPVIRIRQLLQKAVKRYPFYAQQSSSDCGVACLVMISRYHGKSFSINRLRSIIPVDQNGTSLINLSAGAESIGFASRRPIKIKNVNGLAKQKLPAIVPFKYKHYVVVDEITKKEVIVSDPAIGQRTLSHDEFKRNWTGLTLILEPTITFKKQKNDSISFFPFLEILKPHSYLLFQVFIASIFIHVFGLITPLCTQLILDKVLVHKSETTLTAIGIGLLILNIFRVAMIGLRQYFIDHTANRIDIAFLVGFIRHTFRLPLSFYESRRVGDIISRVQENKKIQNLLSGESLSTLLDLIAAIIYIVLMFYYSWKIALLILPIIVSYVILAFFATPFLQRISREIFYALARQRSYLIESLTGIRTVKSTGVEQIVRWQWEDLLHKEIKTTFIGQVVSNRLQISSNTIESLANISLLWFGSYLVIHGQLTIGQLVGLNMLLGNIIRPFQRLIILWNQFQEGIIAIERITDVLASEPEEDLLQQSRESLPCIQGNICLQNATLCYPKSKRNTLENVSFEIKSGQTVALVGRSGSGKTSIAKLILGLYSTTDGEVLIDGRNINSLSLHSLRQQIGIVDQDTFLFDGTILDNISLGCLNPKSEDIIQAAKLAGLHEFIQGLPMRYQTHIGEGGNLVSGGQRQRMAIARAVFRNPQFLILDEASAHLDSESEKIVQQNLQSFLKDKTSLVISHRLSTIRDADMILVLKEGRLVESGTYEELIERRAHFFHIFKEQL